MSGDDITLAFETDPGDDISFAIETPTACGVTSVNGHTGAVALDADDVGADPAGTATAAVAAAVSGLTKTSVGLGAVDNVSAAALRDRSTHTGTQPPSSIDGVAVVDGDTRLTNARPPTGHAASHATGGTDRITPASIGAAVPVVVVGCPPEAAAGTVLSPQAADRVYFIEVPATPGPASVSRAWVDFVAVVAASFVAGLYRIDTGALLATTGPTAVPGAAGVASFAVPSVAVPAGVRIAAAFGLSVATGVQVRSVTGASSGWYGGAGALRYGAQATAAGLVLPSTLPAAGTLQRYPAVLFT